MDPTREGSAPSSPPLPWYLHPVLHLVLNCLLMTVSELLLKRGATETALIAAPRWLAWSGITSLGSGWVLAGIAVYILAFMNWLHVLRWMPLSKAFPVTSSVHVLISLGAWIFLRERIGPLRWAGIFLITAGIVFCARPAAAAEERL
jgi:drug/metabolite transporter (DMT)-like permease